MSKSTKSTKQSMLSQTFKSRAVTMPEEALAYMFMAAFGVSLVRLVSIANDIAARKDFKLAMLCITSGVQIRANVVFVGSDYGNVRTLYPELIIEGMREQQDQFNFGALHALGHLLSHASSHDLAVKALKKAGSCINNTYATDSEAGKINSEIAKSWTSEDRQAFDQYISTAAAVVSPFVTAVFTSVSAKATAFSAAPGPAASTAVKASGTT